MDLEDEVILLELNECIAVKNNQVSLQSTFLATEADDIVNNITKRYNWKQNIECDGCQLPLNVKDGLLNPKIHKPTMEEWMSCIRRTLTNDELWGIEN